MVATTLGETVQTVHAARATIKRNKKMDGRVALPNATSLVALRDDVETLLAREAAQNDRVVIATRKLVSRRDPPRSSHAALAEILELDQRLVKDSKRCGRAAAVREAALILTARTRKGIDAALLRFRLLSARRATLSHLRFLMDERAGLVDEAVLLLKDMMAPLVARVRGLRRRIAVDRLRPESAQHRRTGAHHALRTDLEELRALENQLRRIDGLGLFALRPGVVSSRVRAVGGRGLNLLADEPLSLAASLHPPRSRFSELQALVMTARQVGSDDEAANAPSSAAAPSGSGASLRGGLIGATEGNVLSAAVSAASMPPDSPRVLFASPSSGQLRVQPSAASRAGKGGAPDWREGERRRQAAIRANGQVKDARSAKLQLDEQARNERTSAKAELEGTQAALARLRARPAKSPENCEASALQPVATETHEVIAGIGIGGPERAVAGMASPCLRSAADDGATDNVAAGGAADDVSSGSPTDGRTKKMTVAQAATAQVPSHTDGGEASPSVVGRASSATSDKRSARLRTLSKPSFKLASTPSPVVCAPFTSPPDGCDSVGDVFKFFASGGRSRPTPSSRTPKPKTRSALSAAFVQGARVVLASLLGSPDEAGESEAHDAATSSVASLANEAVLPFDGISAGGPVSESSFQPAQAINPTGNVSVIHPTGGSGHGVSCGAGDGTTGGATSGSTASDRAASAVGDGVSDGGDGKPSDAAFDGASCGTSSSVAPKRLACAAREDALGAARDRNESTPCLGAGHNSESTPRLGAGHSIALPPAGDGSPMALPPPPLVSSGISLAMTGLLAELDSSIASLHPPHLRPSAAGRDAGLRASQQSLQRLPKQRANSAQPRPTPTLFGGAKSAIVPPARARPPLATVNRLSNHLSHHLSMAPAAKGAMGALRPQSAVTSGADVTCRSFASLPAGGMLPRSRPPLEREAARVLPPTVPLRRSTTPMQRSRSVATMPSVGVRHGLSSASSHTLVRLV